MNHEEVLRRLYRYYGNDKVLASEARRCEAWKVLISTILSARSRDAVTFKVADKLFERYENLRELAEADVGDVKRMIRSIGFYNNKGQET